MLVHNYSIGKYLAITGDSENLPKIDSSISGHHITSQQLLKDLEIAFDSFVKDLKGDTEVRKNALERYKIAPPIVGVDSGFISYSKEESEYLISYYRPQIKSRLANGNPLLRMHDIKMVLAQGADTNNPFFVVCVARYAGEDYSFHLDKITQQLGIEYPIEVLNKSNLFPKSSLPIPKKPT